LDAGSTEVALALSQAEFNRLVDDHSPALYRMAFRMVGDRHEAEDMVQEAFRSAWKSRNAYQEGRGDRAWLAAILRRRIVDRWRRRPAPTTSGSDLPLDVGVAGVDPLGSDYTDEMQAALALLPAELRETLLLVVVGELTHQEAADLLDVPLGTVLSRVSRARRRLRERLLASRIHEN
jgi:RNA polymerase sigma-70 factor (ECF subfamily)